MTAAIATALPPGIDPRNVRRAYEVKKVTRKRTQVTFTKGEDGKLVRDNKEETVKGFMVYFPQKHSIFVESEAMLEQMKLHHKSGLVDMESGMPIEEVAIPSLADAHDEQE